MIVAVNLSAVQFHHEHLSALVQTILDEVKLPPWYLELELTESVAAQNPERAIETMNRLHEKGIRLAIDDFGTGYSSLSYLKRFHVYRLKIDQSFIRDINEDADDRAIVATIIALAKSLGLKTIAEGVETKEQLDFLISQGCDEVQGYYFSKPLSVDDFEKKMRNH
jgi:EAL domain-containing protein (putative c-di-GMP-specific phosphodiesterase class I)